MMRYSSRLKERGAGRLIVYCDPLLVRITQTIAGANFVSLQKGDDANQLEEVS